MEVFELSSQKIRIRLKGYDHEIVDQSSKLIVDTAQKTGARVSGPVPLPTERNLYTVIRSPHKDKDSREHRAKVPLGEMFGYATDLRSQTQGRASYTMQFDSYDPVPKNIKDEIVSKSGGSAS